MLQKILCVAVGGALGAVSRFLVMDAMRSLLVVSFPWWTLTVNVAGSFLAGIAVRYFALESSHQWLWTILVVGFLGGFTTFSAFSVDLLEMFQKQNYALMGLNVLLHVVCCFLAVIAGYEFSKIFFA